MHETPDDLAFVQDVLDRSHAGAGAHLRDVITPDRRLTAQQLSELLVDMRLLVLATVSADGRPITGAVDGFFYRGRFHFSSSPQSVRFRHIAARPQVSATHLPGEELQVVVHGRAERIDVKAPEHAAFFQVLVDYYVPRYGDMWTNMIEAGAGFARIEPDKMFTFWMPPEH